MANLKFSQFTEQTDTSNVQFIVGYNGATNVRISPDNINGAYLPLAGGTLTGNVLFTDNTQLQLGTGNDMQIYHDPSGSGTNIFNSTLGSLKFIQNQNDGLIEFENDNGSGGIESYFILNGSDETIRAYKTLKSGTTNLALEANNAGFVEIRSANGTTPGTLQLNCEQNSHGIKIQGPPHSAGANYTLVFPTTDGGTGEFLQTNGSGVLTWAAAGTGTVTSVGLAMPAAFSVASSPVTTSGTLTVTGAGTTSQYIRGDGTLATLPGGFTSFDITGGSGSAQTITNGNTVTLAQGTGISTVAGATDTVTITNTLPFNSLTLAGDSGASQSITNNNTITLAGGTGLSSVASATDTVTFNANVDGTQSVAANTSTTTAARTYKVQVDSSDNLVVNVPWTSGSSGIAGTISTNQVAYGTATDTIGGHSGLTYDGFGTLTATQIDCTSYLYLANDILHRGDTNTKFGFPSNDTFTINTNGSERMRIASTGAVQLNTYGSGTFTGTAAYALSVDSSGNIIETTGGGNEFASGLYIGGTAAANLLDEYEKGTFTPTVTSSYTGGYPTPGTHYGYYERVGEWVTVGFNLQFRGGVSSSTTFTLTNITNLPFTALNVSGNTANGATIYNYVTNNNENANTNDYGARISNNSTTTSFYEGTSSTQVFTVAATQSRYVTGVVKYRVFA